jgi:hypothetical protein
MFLGIHTAYFGEVDIEIWEYSLMLMYLLVLYFYFARIKNARIGKQPEYKYFLFGLYAKIFGGIVFSMIYFYYYKGGDTISYFYSATALSNLAKIDFFDYLQVLFGPNDVATRQFFTMETGSPYYFVYYEARAYMVVRLISVLILFTFNSYLITTVIISSISYFGVFRLYQTVVRYYPSLMRPLAYAILFMPSVIFWGSAILKDTFTFSALCWYLHCVDNLAFRKRSMAFSWLALVVSILLMISIKPYIFMVVMPASLVWISYYRLARIKSVIVKYLFLPLLVVGLMLSTLYVLTKLGGYLDKFSLDSALRTIIISQNDMIRSEQYGQGYFNVGPMEESWLSVFSKAPIAISAGLFRPFLWESTSVIMAFAGVENLVVLFLFIIAMLKGQIINTVRLVTKNPLLLTFMTFTIAYAFVIGISTPNFGALVRFKIPLLPLFVSSLIISNYIMTRRREVLRSGMRFNYDDFLRGEPGRPTDR